MKNINIQFIDQKYQRFNNIGQVGDYWETDTSIEFRITKFDNPAYSYAILLHELHEKFRNNQLGIKDEDVDAFDSAHPELDDPGLSKEAPYHKTHMEADCIERQYIVSSGNDWVDYEAAIEKETT